MIKRICSTCILFFVLFMVVIPHSSYAAAQERLFMVNNVEPISQFPQLPSGCEITATTMLLNYFGASTSKMEVAKLLPKGSMPRVVNNSYIGGNPNDGFVGNPNSAIGYGVFEIPILKIVEHYLPGKSKNLTGASFNDLLFTIREGSPVVVWATLNMKEPIQVDEWMDNKGNRIQWNGPEHVLLFVGWDDNNGYFNDPYTGKRVTYNLWLFKDRWEKMGSRAVTVEPRSATVTSLTYGDYDDNLGIGERISVPSMVANYESGRQTDVTSSVQFASNDPGITINDKTITGVSEGKASITASYADKTVTFSFQIHAFGDIEDHWARDTIAWARKLKIADGYPDATFKPDSKVTEAEFLAMLFRLYPNSMRSLDGDIPDNGVWSDLYYTHAKNFNLGLDGSSRDTAINRLKVAQIISGLSGKSFSNYDEAVKFLLDNGYSQGKTSATVSGYGGNDQLTRAEALQFLINLQKKGLITLKARPIHQTE